MKKWVVFVLIFSACVAAFGDAGETTVHVLEYLEQFLAQSVPLQVAIGNAEEALEALEDAQTSQESTYDIELLRNEYRSRQAEVPATENLEVREAFQRVFAFSAAKRAVSYAETTEQIRTAERERADQLLRIGELSLQDKHAAHIAHLQASSDLRTAMDQYRVAQRALIRPLGQTRDRLEIIEFALSAPVPEISETDRIIDENAYVQKLQADLSLLVERREHLGNSQVVSPTELEVLDDNIEQTELLLQQQIWLLQDAVEQLHSDLTGNQQAAAIAELNAETKAMDLSAARHQYDSGDIHASDLAQAELLHSMAVDQLSALRQSRLMLTMDALSIMSESLKQWVQEELAD